MANLNEQFKTFLSNINPDKEAVKYAQEAHEPVRECLESEDEFKQYVTDSFLYGSYKRHTAIGDIKDVDIVILTNFDIEDENNTPQTVLRKLKAALGRCYDDPENPQYQRRSIRIDDPLPDHEDVHMTLDIIPAVMTAGPDDPLLVPDREVKQWILSHPKGHLKHTSALNELSNKRFVRLVKMMKWWWQYQCEIRQPDVERPKPKGFWVECLTGEMFDLTQTAWDDHFIAVLENIVTTFTGTNEVPTLSDPGIEHETLQTNMTLAEFNIFLSAAEESLSQARKARDTQDPVESSILWREIFGEKFPLYDQDETEDTRREASSILAGVSSHKRDLPWPINLQKRYKVRIDAVLYIGNQKTGGINSNGRILQSGLNIKYVARTKMCSDCEIHWQVVNTGKHAATETNGLRGDFFPAKDLENNLSPDPLVNWEHTKYTGKHWIECFVVRHGVCVGRSGKFFVNIKNPAYP